MPSTYTTNNGIELIATGEQSGTWGETTNTNLELLDASLDGQVTVTLSTAGTSGSPNDLPVTNGSSSNGRNRVVIFNDGADLGATAFVQLTPNDAEKIMYIRNSLSGSRDLIVFQGTYNASNDYVVPNGTTAVVLFDGAGTGAVAANVFNNAAFDSLQLGTSDVSVNKILDQDNMSGNDASALATQQSIKAYVDSQVGSFDTLAEVLAQGNTTGGTDIAVGTGDDITFADSSKAIFGAGSDLQIQHTGTDSRIVDSGTGTFYIAGTDLVLLDGTLAERYADFTFGGAARLYFDNSVKLATFSGGVSVTGTVASDGLSMGDGDIATFGNSNDLQIYHDGSNSYVKENGTGNLYFTSNGTSIAFGNNDLSELYAVFNNDGEAKLFFNGSQKLATSSTGIDVTGTVTADGLTVDGDAIIKSGGVNNTPADLSLWHTDVSIVSGDDLAVISAEGSDSGGSAPYQGAKILFDAAANWDTGSSNYYPTNIKFFTQDNSGTDTIAAGPRMTISSAGNVGLGTSSPNIANFTKALTILDSSASNQIPAIELAFGSNTRGANIAVDNRASVKALAITAVASDLAMTFGTNNTERMRIDSAGNVLVGTTGTSSTVAGHVIYGGSNAGVTTQTYAGRPLYLNRLTTDGDIIEFAKDNTTVGSIGSNSGANLIIGTGDTGIYFNAGSDAVHPWNIGTNAARSGAIDLGRSDDKFKDLYLSGTANTGSRIVFPEKSTGVESNNSIRAHTNNYLYMFGGSTGLSLANNAGEDTRIKLNDSNTIEFITASTERMRIDASGNVGIGMVPPSDRNLAVYDASNSIFSLHNSTTGTSSGDGFQLQLVSDDAYLVNYEAGGIISFYTTPSGGAATERMRIDSSGQVKVGTTGPTWDSTFGSFVTKGGFLSSQSTSYNYVGGQAYYDGAFKRLNANAAELYEQSFGNHIFYNAISGAAGSTITWNERMRIDSSGNLLVGKTTDAFGTAGIALRGTVADFIRDGGPPINVNRLTNEGNLIAFHKAGALVGSIGSALGDSSVSTLFIADGGNVGLRFDQASTDDIQPCTSAGANRDAAINLGAAGNRFKDLYLSGQWVSNGSNNTLRASFQVSGTQYGYINVATTGTLYSTSSDYRIKENVVALTNATERLKQLNPLRFSFIPDQENTIVDGFFAHEVADVVPEAILGEKDATDDDGNPVYQGIDQSKLVPLLVATIQELEARIAALESN